MQLRKCLPVLLLLITASAHADPLPDQPYTVEYYYHIKPGFENEWMELYKRSHWPIMVEEIKQGYVLDIKVSEQRHYMPEPHRWNLRISITYKDASTRYSNRNREQLLAQLFTDREQQERDENRRKELLHALWEIASKPVATSEWEKK